MRSPQLRLALALAVGVAAALLLPLPDDAGWPASALAGWVVAATLFCIPVIHHIRTFDAAATRRLGESSEGNRTETDLVVMLAAVGSLVAVGWMLVEGKDATRSLQVFEGVLAVLAVAASWTAIQLVYTLRYARHWYAVESDSVAFEGSPGDPPLSDFAYLAFTLGMTYQVSDTNLRTPLTRRLVLGHALLSYLFGAVVLASTVNLVLGLAS